MAAENAERNSNGATNVWASMRPRRMAAENARSTAAAVPPAVSASMRPRRMAAENVFG